MASPFCKRFVKNHVIAGFIEHGCDDDYSLSMYIFTIWWYGFLSDHMQTPPSYAYPLDDSSKSYFLLSVQNSKHPIPMFTISDNCTISVLIKANSNGNTLNVLWVFPPKCKL